MSGAVTEVTAPDGGDQFRCASQPANAPIPNAIPKVTPMDFTGFFFTVKTASSTKSPAAMRLLRTARLAVLIPSSAASASASLKRSASRPASASFVAVLIANTVGSMTPPSLHANGLPPCFPLLYLLQLAYHPGPDGRPR